MYKRQARASRRRRKNDFRRVKNFLLQKKQFLLYCVIGVSGVTVDFAVYSLLVKTGRLDYQAANAISYALSLIHI